MMFVEDNSSKLIEEPDSSKYWNSLEREEIHINIKFTRKKERQRVLVTDENTITYTTERKRVFIFYFQNADR